MRIVEGRILSRAAAMHYTSVAEQREAEQAGASAPGMVIPIGIDPHPFNDLPDCELFLNAHPQARGRRLVLFLSRLDQKKGLDLLLPAFAEVHRKHRDAMLVLAGTGSPIFIDSLRRLAAEMRISQATLWTGFIDGAEKLAAFAASSVFALPSYSENFGIALVEALAAGLPCVTTEGVAISADVRANGAGIVAETQVSSIAHAIDRLLIDSELRESCAVKARALVRERYSLERMGVALAQLYRATALQSNL
jgi:glycosyltransferase involved in cell wall biosynthesis